MNDSIGDFCTFEGCVIAQPDGDLGDAPQRTAMYHIGKRLLGEDPGVSFEEAIAKLSDPNGQLIRDPIRWNDPADISRDQQEPWIIALALINKNAEVRRLVFQRWRRFGKYPNADWMNPSGLATDLRALNWRYVKPLIWFGDLWSCAGAVIDCARAKIHQGIDGPWLDMDNALTRLAFAHARSPSVFSRAAVRIYVHFFPDNVGGASLLGALANKHRLGAGNPAMASLWQRVWLSMIP